MNRPDKGILQGVIFDVDGVLIDSEPFWRESEMEAFSRQGIQLTEADCMLTTGMRIGEVVRFWYARRPWEGASPEELAREILDGVMNRIQTRGAPMRGVHEAIRFFQTRGLRLALASSSAMALIDAVVDKLGIRPAFEVICSAENEALGKPHPQVYLTAADRLGLPPARCLAVEDSIHGVMAAKAAKMKCIAIPLPELRQDPRYLQADAVLDSLVGMNEEIFNRLNRGEKNRVAG